MKTKLSLSATLILLAAPSQAAVLAFTNFDDSTASTNTKSNLNWILNGLNDPGDMSASQFGGGAVNIFDGSSLTQDSFTPGLNVGNTDSSWETDIPISVAAGFDVTLTEVTFNSLSVNGGQSENVDRQNDYRITILNPGSVVVATAEQADVSAGTTAGQPLVTLDFPDVVLSDPGTYTLRIRSGDFLVANETGNHTGLDNLSINGEASPIPEPSAIVLSALSLFGLLSARRR